ncbi:hypothetical protein D3C72_1948390 [compost metagenome]
MATGKARELSVAQPESVPAIVPSTAIATPETSIREIILTEYSFEKRGCPGTTMRSGS